MADFSRPVDEIAVDVPPEHAGQRIDRYLARRMNWRSRHHFIGLFTDGDVSVGGRVVKKSYQVRAGDRITIRLPAVYREQFDYASMPLSILHEDDDLIVVDKAGDVAVQPTGKYIHENLLYRLRYHYREERGLPDVEPAIVHRLDRETSGVIVFGKHRDAASMLTQQFAAKTTAKRYLAIVHGDPGKPGSVDVPLLATDDRHVVVDPAGRSALTDYEVLERAGDYSLLGVRIHTGRQHQIRVHLAHIGVPIVCDDLYGRPADRDNPGLPGRQLLHAHELTLRHPAGPEVRYCSPMPADMRAALAGASS